MEDVQQEERLTCIGGVPLADGTHFMRVYPQEVESLDREERPASPWWKCRKWIMNIAYRLLSRYGEPKHCKEGNDKKFGELFKVGNGPVSLKAVMQLGSDQPCCPAP